MFKSLSRTFYFSVLGCLISFSSNSYAIIQTLQLIDKISMVNKVAYAWTFFGPDSTFWVRALVETENCPKLKIDSQIVPMKVRQVKESAQFPIHVCEAQISPVSRRIELGHEILSVAVMNPKKIVILGDTGCVIKKTTHGKPKVQSCNDPTKWPFAQISQSAEKWKPDLIIHVGDYHYRESNCPPSDPSCKGAISGDQWESWKQDFFSPAAPLLKSAPWIFARGNHELCKRAGNGWFRFLEPRQAPAECTDRTDPYRVKLDGLSLAVVDAADDHNISGSLKKLSESSQNGEWLVLHRPFLTPGADNEASQPTFLPKHLQGPGQLGLVLTGHQHRMSLNQFADSRPPEVISGNGGTLLEKPQGTLLKSEFNSMSFSEYGFLTLEHQMDSKWLLSARDVAGKEMIRCDLKQELGRQTMLNCSSL